jgi:hypothetical protein
VQARECEFRLATGRKCRAAANRNQPFCRHHAPSSAVPAEPPIPKEERYSDLRRWRRLGAQLHSMPADEIPNAVFEILQCLVDRGLDSTGHISDLTAGRFLRALLNRLGDVPFPDPDLAFVSESSAAPASWPGPCSVAIPQTPGFSAPQPPQSTKDYNALLAALGLPPLQAPYPQSRPQFHPSHAPMNQSRTRVNQ